jgi:hypothetical protein
VFSPRQRRDGSLQQRRRLFCARGHIECRSAFGRGRTAGGNADFLANLVLAAAGARRRRAP